ncbi:haloacid dehalogenase-like domain-containing protein [Tanacetum coccineum]|uniref:Haloacid dehalogenase-like domain-containing protein n=1 Tax=Tanacetum coccineum TaxID=301880 RepID=A0ABQ5GJM1_9ASTR
MDVRETMAGLWAFGYKFDNDDYHSYVHGRLPYQNLKPDPVLRTLLHSLPIRKVIFSNANEAHVAEVLHRLGLEDCFDDVICFESLNPTNEITNPDASQSSIIEYDSESCDGLRESPIVCKPFENAFQQAFQMANINPHKTTSKLTGPHPLCWVGSSPAYERSLDYALEEASTTFREALPELGNHVNRLCFDLSQKICNLETRVEA